MSRSKSLGVGSITFNNAIPELLDDVYTRQPPYPTQEDVMIEAFITAVERNTNGVRTRLLNALKDVS